MLNYPNLERRHTKNRNHHHLNNIWLLTVGIYLLGISFIGSEVPTQLHFGQAGNTKTWSWLSHFTWSFNNFHVNGIWSCEESGHQVDDKDEEKASFDLHSSTERINDDNKPGFQRSIFHCHSSHFDKLLSNFTFLFAYFQTYITLKGD